LCSRVIKRGTAFGTIAKRWRPGNQGETECRTRGGWSGEERNYRTLKNDSIKTWKKGTKLANTATFGKGGEDYKNVDRTEKKKQNSGTSTAPKLWTEALVGERSGKTILRVGKGGGKD